MGACVSKATELRNRLRNRAQVASPISALHRLALIRVRRLNSPGRLANGAKARLRCDPADTHTPIGTLAAFAEKPHTGMMPVPEPNSPEAKRAAQKVRSVFFFIAAANLVIIALVMWPRPKLPDHRTPPPQNESALATDPALVAMEASLDRLLDAYHARDAERFADSFSAPATPPIDEEYFRTVIIGGYHENFGEITHRQLAADSELQASEPLLIHEIYARKAPKGKMITRFRREGEGFKPIRWELQRE